MNTRLISSLTLALSFTLSIFAFSFASAEAQTNNAPVTGRLSKYTPLKAPFLRIGSRGQAVKDVQAVLRSLGFYNGTIDGIYGNRTTRAVAAFQRSQKLVGDGQVGTFTWQALRNKNNVLPMPGPF